MKNREINATGTSDNCIQQRFLFENLNDNITFNLKVLFELKY